MTLGVSGVMSRLSETLDVVRVEGGGMSMGSRQWFIPEQSKHVYDIRNSAVHLGDLIENFGLLIVNHALYLKGLVFLPNKVEN